MAASLTVEAINKYGTGQGFHRMTVPCCKLGSLSFPGLQTIKLFKVCAILPFPVPPVHLAFYRHMLLCLKGQYEIQLLHRLLLYNVLQVSAGDFCDNIAIRIT